MALHLLLTLAVVCVVAEPIQPVAISEPVKTEEANGPALPEIDAVAAKVSLHIYFFGPSSCIQRPTFVTLCRFKQLRGGQSRQRPRGLVALLRTP